MRQTALAVLLQDRDPTQQGIIQDQRLIIALMNHTIT